MHNHVKQYRLAAKLTPTQLADLVGTSRQTIHNIEGGSHPDVFLARRLANALGCAVETLFHLDNCFTTARF